LINSAPACKTCGKALALATGPQTDTLVEEESARCAQLREIAQRRRVLAAKMQSGVTGLLGGDTVDTVDLVAHRKGLAQLDAALQAQAEALAGAMVHSPH
jgi:hypothetical protein